MAQTKLNAKVGKRTIELSNLNKVLYPDDGVIKAELIEYYLKIAPTILPHIKGRPLSLVRFPDGIDKQRFFQKNRQEWAPDWLAHVLLGDHDKIDYVLATEDASLVWLANLACIEIHQTGARAPHYDKPDYVAFDIDPPENYPFTSVVDIANDLRAAIERVGYHTFVKTTGGKGVHIYAPIEPKWDFDAVRDAALQISQSFVAQHSKTTTLRMKKDQRENRVFIDIYRNQTYQTSVSPYSVRGRPRAPVSMPLTWEALQPITDPAVFNVRTALDHVTSEGDPWEAMAAYAVPLHTKAQTVVAASGSRAKKLKEEPPESLAEYARKRKFDKTPEPGPSIVPGSGDAFVVHRHHASRLHYDLRIEKDGVLRSWAVPRGMPPRPGIKRMAVQTEDHPLSYLNFHGTIPKGEYGAGDMWIFALGRYEITKEKKDGFYLRLNSPELNAEYRMIHTREKEWLVERLENPQIDWLQQPIEPMLSDTRDEPFDSDAYLYEVKWDGIRATVVLDEGKITVRSRSKQDITHAFPELQSPEKRFRATSALFDVEIVSLDERGAPVFENVLGRLQARSESAVARARAKHPAICYIFDCLYLDGRPIIHEPLWKRRAWMADSIIQNPTYRVSEAMDEGVSLYRAVQQMGLEGIIAKKRDSPYLPGKRSEHWIKIKSRTTQDAIILGYTPGRGEREDSFGALQLGVYRGESIEYIGKVGGGFSDKARRTLLADLRELKTVKRYVSEKPPDDAVTVWVEPKFVCEVQYASIIRGHLREPVFLRLRPDVMPKDVVSG